MERTILIRIGEIFLKGNNKRFFTSLLKKNINVALENYQHTFVNSQNRMYIENYKESEECEILDKLQKVFGIYSISTAVKIPTDLDEIAKLCAEIFPKKGTFRVTINRADKTIPKKSTEIASDIGGYMLEKANGELKVDLFNYEFEVSIDIRESSYSYIFFNRLLCSGGLPVGCSGNGMLLLSGGIDSPVAGYMMAKRGLKLYAVHYHSFPYTSEQAKEKVIELANRMSEYSGEVTLLVVPFTNIQYAIKQNCPIEYMITIMRRFMMKIAERLAKENSCGALITGENLGQVASQTMESINVTNSVVKMPVFRPLIGFDKAEIIEKAIKMDTFKTSILPFEDCCTVFLPKNPVIKPKINTAIEYENQIEDRDNLIEEAIKNVETIICKR
ncbi:MAG: tRNA uracil 4-sulfurtransferase ThiI [Clostridia bacterium]